MRECVAFVAIHNLISRLLITLLQLKVIDCHENFANFLAMTQNNP
ncbi:hypothetical protein [Helicobacter rodentium]|nr:hypothetical protein [Helicobacter rodentium]